MSEQDKKSGGAGPAPSAPEQASDSRHKAPARLADRQDLCDHHYKHSKAPAAPAVVEELQHVPAETIEQVNEEDKEHKRAKSEMSKQTIAKKLSSAPKKVSSPESIALAHVEIDTKKGSITPPSQPIPQDVEALSGATFDDKDKQKGGETDSIAGEIADGRTVDTSRKYSNWSDEEEAGGLPRSQSRASRVSRVVRQFFCCGVPYEAPSEENVSSGRAFGQGI